jgi:hypothetical protein
MSESFILFGFYVGLLGLGMSLTFLSTGLKVEFQRDEKALADAKKYKKSMEV